MELTDGRVWIVSAIASGTVGHEPAVKCLKPGGKSAAPGFR